MNIEEAVEYHKQAGHELLLRNVNPATRDRTEMILAVRHCIAAWVLTEATVEQLEAIDKIRPFRI